MTLFKECDDLFKNFKVCVDGTTLYERASGSCDSYQKIFLSCMDREVAKKKKESRERGERSRAAWEKSNKELDFQKWQTELPNCGYS
ncbi:hypothetical protein HDU92_001800 [Lobulomyces angularis]|nr:hypothetical protein HDU92_001800 [Lobulomyces angularis]